MVDTGNDIDSDEVPDHNRQRTDIAKDVSSLREP